MSLVGAIVLFVIGLLLYLLTLGLLHVIGLVLAIVGGVVALFMLVSGARL